MRKEKYHIYLSDEDLKRVVVYGVVFYNDEKVARIFKKHGFYRYLKEVGVDWTKIISKKLLPDDSIYVIISNTLFIIECKYQQVAGSVDEKLQTCDFKRKQYQKLMAQLNIDVEYIYLLSEWFKDPKYKDVLDYIISMPALLRSTTPLRPYERRGDLYLRIYFKI